MWLDLLKSRYGDISLKALGADDQVKVSPLYSWWWKDVLKIYYASSFSPRHSLDPIAGGCKFIIHNGFQTSFWFAAWLDDTPLFENFPDLYKLSGFKNVSVATMGGWKDDVWKWGDLGLPGFVEEESELSVQLNILKGRLESFEGWKEGKDIVVWLGNSDRIFSVASCFDMYERSRTCFGPPIKHAEVFGLL